MAISLYGCGDYTIIFPRSKATADIHLRACAEQPQFEGDHCSRVATLITAITVRVYFPTQISATCTATATVLDG